MDYSVKEKDYELKEEVGHGASAIVYRAVYLPCKEVVAVKCLDLERCSSNLDGVRREAQTMSLIDHPNLIRAYCSFVVKQCLWVIMPYMAQGSCLHLMKIAYPDGFDEPIICSILKETLKALVYLHCHGHIHRDVKAGNILFDNSGSIKLGDFGVSAFLYGNGDRQRTRNTFVGTPCWMAPEVLQPGSGYDFKADIWSFGITALELAHGHAPFSKFPPMKVLLMTIQNAPPGLDYDRDKKFSKSFKEMVAMCLVKDQTKRPTAEKLLKHSFFKNVKSPEVTVKKLLTGLAPLWDRVKELQLKDAAALASKKMSSAEQMSQSEYKRGVSAWIFDIKDLKIQASLIQEDEVPSAMKEEHGSMRHVSEMDPSLPKTETGKSVLKEDDLSAMSETEGLTEKNEVENEIVEVDLPNTRSHGKNNVYELSKWRSGPISMSKKGPESNLLKSDLAKKPQVHSGSISSASILSHSFRDGGKISGRFGGENQLGADGCKHNIRKTPSFSGPLMLPKRASENSLSAPTASVKSTGGYRDTLEEKSRVQMKGRFSVTSEDVDIVKGPLEKSPSFDILTNHKEVPVDQLVKNIGSSRLPASLFVPYLQNLYQQTSFQLDLIKTIQNSLEPTNKSGGISTVTSSVDSVDDMVVEPAASERERLLLMKISELQARVSSLTDDLTATKIKHVQLQQQLASTYGQEETNSTGKEGKKS